MIKSKLREREALWRKTALLTAARTIFTRKGFHRATMDDVAKEAGISKGALYLYFPSKEKMFMALIAEGLNDRAALVRGILEQNIGCREKLQSYIGHNFDYFEKNRDLWTIVMMLERDVLCTDIQKNIHEQAMKEMKRILSYLIAIMKQGIKEKILKNESPELLALGLGGMVQIFIMRAMFENARKFQAKEKQFILEVFLEGAKA
ncbi:MAG: TetR/AcrR family transcriptional regulator [bacterium]|nr:TetR/AcrR family transcriptional regulator [bacterium]MDD5354610.1 TetR/AcrR family transcriptional regulator [bacterium]MDD5755653.1 TetR/AcrR family transcriptional regulator [bacterium]